VLEYWIVDWQAHAIEIYRRKDAHLDVLATLMKDVLKVPFSLASLPGSIFVDIS
jgi:membrane-anchored protein YejM (alkaline phosphatase superfamily)